MAKFERYTPENPLPEEIQQLEREETVCKFCGVSYLIHNEMKKLEQRLADTLAQLTDYNNMKSSFDEVTNELNEGRNKLKRYEKDIIGYQDSISSLGDELDKLKKILAEKSDKILGYEAQILEDSKTLNSNVQELNKFKSIALQYPKLLDVVKATQSERRQLQDQFNLFSSTFVKIIAEAIESNNQTGLFVKSVLHDTHTLNSENTSLLSQKNALEQTNQDNVIQVKVLKEKCKEFRTVQLHKDELAKLAASLQLKIEDLEKDNKLMHTNSGKLEKELSFRADKITDLNAKIDELNRNYVHQISELNAKYGSSVGVQEKLQAQISSQMEQFEQLKDKNSVQCAELQAKNAELTNKIKLLDDENKKLTQTKRDTTEKQKLQMSALHESHEEEVSDLKKIIKTLENKVEGMSEYNDGYDRALKEAINKVNMEHDGVIRALQQDNRLAHEELQNQISILSGRYDKDLKAKERTIYELERSYQVQLREVQEERDKIASLHEEAQRNINLYEDKLNAVRNSSISVEESSSLKSRNRQLEDDVLALQRVVQRECEERLALTETLENFKSAIQTSHDDNNSNSRLTNRPKINKPKISSKNMGRVRKPF